MRLLTVLMALMCLNASAQKENTAFQVGQPYRPTIHVNADVAIVYGVNGNVTEGKMRLSFEDRLASWRNAGYTTHFMSGMAWGSYQDYFTGKWDGRTHWDEGQVTQQGDTCWHGRKVPYIVPTMNYLKYFKECIIKRVIDAGIDAIYLEEPEYWSYAGYSDAFKREWEDFYHSPWQPQHMSANATYLSNKLKYHLYFRALDECFRYAKEYGRSKGMDVRCYVPTHSLINYSQWHIVSPEASLASLSAMDGYIAQVWTGTARCQNYYDGRRAERIFENAFLEYGCLESMTAPTGRRVYFLTDPIEDAVHDWADYKRGYEATYTAKMLYPHNNYYEVMPWPDRIFERLYPASADHQFQGKIEDFHPTTGKGMMRIPPAFATQMQVMIDAEGRMPLSNNEVSGTQGFRVLMANSLMFQRATAPVEGYEDPQLAGFHGLALPLLKRGVPVQTMHIENTAYQANWEGVSTLLMTYYNMKPLDPDAHRHIAEWVRKGGTLIYAGRDDDPFQQVDEWWKATGYDCPSEHLFETLGMERKPADGMFTSGEGKVVVIRQNPGEFVLTEGGDEPLISAISKVTDCITWKNHFTLQRGPYLLSAVMNESITDKPLCHKGRFIDLFEPSLPVISSKEIHPGEQSMLLCLDSINKDKPSVLAASTAVSNEEIGWRNTGKRTNASTYSFITRGPEQTQALMRIWLPSKPKRIDVMQTQDTQAVPFQSNWDKTSNTLLLKYDNSATGRQIRISL